MIESTINSTIDTKHTPELRSKLHDRYTGRLSKDSNANDSRFCSSIFIPALNTFEITNHDHDHDRLIDSDKSSSLLTGTSFDALMNSLKTMREKDLDFIIRHSGDNSIRLTN